MWSLYKNTHAQNATLRGIRFEAYAHKKTLAEGAKGIAVSLTQTAIGKSTAQVTIPASLPKKVLPDNNLRQNLINAIAEARRQTNGGYVLPHVSNFPGLDSAFASVGSTVSLQMEAGQSEPLSQNVGTVFSALQCQDLYFVVPDDLTMSRKLAGGTAQLKQY